MTSPIQVRDTALRVDALVHDVMREAAQVRRPVAPDITRDDVRLDDSRPRFSDDNGDTIHHAAEAGHVLKAVQFVGEQWAAHAGLVETGLVSTSLAATAPFVAGYAMSSGAAQQFHRGENQNRQLHYDRLCGILAALEQRGDSPEVQARARQNPSFAAGLQDAMTAPPVVVAAAQAAVFQSRDEGYSAVAMGQDTGRAFQHRYHADLAFHHAVDYARRQREHGGAEWDAMQARAQSQQAILERGASGVAVRP